ITDPQRARYRELTLCWRRPTEEQPAWARTTAAAGPQVARRADLSYIYAQRTLKLAEYPDTTTVPRQVPASYLWDAGIFSNSVIASSSANSLSEASVSKRFVPSHVSLPIALEAE